MNQLNKKQTKKMLKVKKVKRAVPIEDEIDRALAEDGLEDYFDPSSLDGLDWAEAHGAYQDEDGDWIV